MNVTYPTNCFLTTFFQQGRQMLDAIEFHNPKIARLLCQVIPASCPFERNIQMFGHTFHIPPLCKINPFYEQFVGLRFRALCYLADEC